MRLSDENFTQDHVRGWPFDFWGGGYRLYGLFQKKISYTLISMEKNSCKEIPGKIILHWKKYLSWHIMLEKILHYCMSEKKFSPEVWGKIFLPHTKSGKEILHNRPSSSFISLCVTANFTGYSRLLGEETSRNHQAYREATSTSQFYKK